MRTARLALEFRNLALLFLAHGRGHLLWLACQVRQLLVDLHDALALMRDDLLIENSVCIARPSTRNGLDPG